MRKEYDFSKGKRGAVLPSPGKPKLPKKTSAKVSDPDNPAWTEAMLGEPVVRHARGQQADPTKVLT